MHYLTKIEHSYKSSLNRLILSTQIRKKNIGLTIIILFLCSLKVLGRNPGSNYGCSLNNQGTYLYTNWNKTVNSAPTNPGWHDTFQIYNDGPSNYNYLIDYNARAGTPGIINPNINPLVSQGKQCFVNRGGSYEQGNLVTYRTTGVTNPAQLPLDDYMPFLLLFTGGLGFTVVRKKAGGARFIS